MSKQELIDTIGKLFVDKQFRDEYFLNFDQKLNSIPGLTNEEKQFLREKNDFLHETIDRMGIKFDGEDKRN